MTAFIPPTSGVFVGAVVDCLQLRQSERLRSSTVRAYFAGERATRDTLRDVFEDLAGALLKAELVPVPPNAPPREVLCAFLLRSAEAWDELVARYRAGPAIPQTPNAPHAFVRLLVVDLALRYATLRRRCGLGPVPDDLRDDQPGLLLRRLIDDAGLTREKLAEAAKVSTTTVDNWCDADVGMEGENLLDVAAALGNELSDQERIAQRLRRHYAFWRLRRAVAFLGEDVTRDAVDAFGRIATAVIAGLERSKLPQAERVRAEDLIFMLGRAFGSTRHLRMHASRTEKDLHWHAALVSDDERYVIAHAQQIAALPEVRAQLDAVGLPVDDRLLSALASAPPPGLAPHPTEIGAREVLVLQGDPSFRANNREALAVAAELRGDLDRAIAEMRRAVAHEPAKALWHLKLGALLGQTRRVDEAIGECRIAAALDPKWELPRVEIGVILLDAGRPQEALEELLGAERAVASPSAHLLYHLGLAHFDVGAVPEAATCFEQALLLKPGDPWAENMLAEALLVLVDRVAGAERRATSQRALRLAKQAALKGCPRALARWQSRNEHP